MVLAGCGEWLDRRLFMSFRLAIVDAYVRSTAIVMRAAMSDTAAKGLGKSIGYVAKLVLPSPARAAAWFS